MFTPILYISTFNPLGVNSLNQFYSLNLHLCKDTSKYAKPLCRGSISPFFHKISPLFFIFTVIYLVLKKKVVPLHRISAKCTHYCGNSSVGRAQPCQGWGREFESRFPLQALEWWNGRHEGLKILWAEMSVRVRVSLRAHHSNS